MDNITCVMCLLLVVVTFPTPVAGQGCSNTCPPLNAGREEPSVCEGDLASSFVTNLDKTYDICYPLSQNQNSFRINDFLGLGKVTVIANYYTGCNAGRRESGVFAQVSQELYQKHGSRTAFIQSVKGGGTCTQWASTYQRDAQQLFPNSDINLAQAEMPLSVNDVDYELRDDWFTPPFGHPGYVILDGELRVRHKFIGPCCGYESFFDCTADIAITLRQDITEKVEAILAEVDVTDLPEDTASSIPPETTPEVVDDCLVGDFSEWSDCSVTCGEGLQFRWRAVTSNTEAMLCPAPVETRSCTATVTECPVLDDDMEVCLPEIGADWELETVASGFNSPRDVAFHPSPGLALGDYSEGRSFYYNMEDLQVEEAWVINGNNHSVSIVSGIHTNQQTTIARTDRGYYHYLINATALSFNSVRDSNRAPSQDSFAYWGVCNDNLNTYLDTKEPNYFMGPTLYNSDPSNRNTVNRLGQPCAPDEPCYFLHSDMLHESPACIGMTHDPETTTAFGNVYFAFDATGDRETGQLVRYDFQQPHGPGSMDHAVAAVRRYTEVKLERGPPGAHAGMIVDPVRRILFVSVPGANKVLRIGADSGSFARSAREEYPIYSSRLPSFEYSIWECVDQDEFATNIDQPSGLAISPDGDRLFVAEKGTGSILVYEIESGALLTKIETGLSSIEGMEFAPRSEELYLVDSASNTLQVIRPTTLCPVNAKVATRMSSTFLDAVSTASAALGEDFSLIRNYQCQADPQIPDAALFDQVHDDSGYASDNPDVQSMAGMDETAALLANRTDCGLTTDLNYDQLLLGGYFCHQCLPDQDKSCDMGGVCSNVQWDGYICDNEFAIVGDASDVAKTVVQSMDGTEVDPSSMMLRNGVTYRFNVRGEGRSACLVSADSVSSNISLACATNGPLLMTVGPESPQLVALEVNGARIFEIQVEAAPQEEDAFSTIGLVFVILAAVVVVVAVGGCVSYFARKRSNESQPSNSDAKSSQQGHVSEVDTGSDD